MTEPPSHKPYPDKSAPRAFDVVWCRWPIDDEPGFKDRPALVRGTFRDKQGQIFVEVAYGTSKINKTFISSFYVANLADMNEAGLFQATRFELAQTIKLPWTSEYFIVREDGSGPLIGRLSEELIFRLKAMLRMINKRQP